MSDSEWQLPSDEKLRSDRDLIAALDEHEPVGEKYARAGETPAPLDRQPGMRPDVEADVVRDPTPVQALAQRRSGFHWVRWSIGFVVVLTVGYSLVTFWQVWSTARSDEARPVDAIVVMGAAQYDGRPSPQLAARLDHVLELWPEGLAPVVVVTGGNQPGDRFTEAGTSATYLIDRGVPDGAIIAEETGTNTYESLRNVAIQLGDSVDSVLIVTDPYHALRTKLTAQSLGFVAFVSPTPDSVVTGARELRRELAESAGVAVGRIIGFDRLANLTD